MRFKASNRRRAITGRVGLAQAQFGDDDHVIADVGRWGHRVREREEAGCLLGCCRGPCWAAAGLALAGSAVMAPFPSFFLFLFPFLFLFSEKQITFEIIVQIGLNQFE